MFDGIRKYVNSPRGQKISTAVLILALLIGGYILFREFDVNAAEQAANTRWFVDATTNQPFEVELSSIQGQAPPIMGPSGKKAGYPAEACYWTKDGGVKKTPTWVLVKNVWLGSDEPTFCPDCGRLVVGHNPAPGPGVKPPPTQDEWSSVRDRGGR